MAYAFIGGIPTAGKTYLGKKVAKEVGCPHFAMDDLRAEMVKEPQLEPYVNFFWNKDEVEYWRTLTPEIYWNDAVKQAEAFWPTILRKISEVRHQYPTAIFEGDTFLPHLAARDLDFSGIFLVGESFESTFERNKLVPRWGKTEELQRIEAEWFFNHHGSRLTDEVKKYGYKVYRNTDEAEKELLHLLRS
ncbi:MAG: hypothetical protein HYV32_02165 [Candidatus Kerfeldbacteria bacterium]|nr:hypothetical protein [Candidatus Kerfeldbacteria bacterium]